MHSRSLLMLFVDHMMRSFFAYTPFKVISSVVFEDSAFMRSSSAETVVLWVTMCSTPEAYGPGVRKGEREKKAKQERAAREMRKYSRCRRGKKKREKSEKEMLKSELGGEMR
ncbi:hypothetical protein CEXT_614211 [Caerostris extrusa]|uniref:Secreted protein n=1 Tax=Caerostris extrusa TaxID=172846 RepID=A0AAV4X341_CAEEX|nr:hypothetical protein CEXT_614211 [Caerostris extrusa]